MRTPWRRCSQPAPVSSERPSDFVTMGPTTPTTVSWDNSVDDGLLERMSGMPATQMMPPQSACTNDLSLCYVHVNRM